MLRQKLEGHMHKFVLKNTFMKSTALLQCSFLFIENIGHSYVLKTAVSKTQVYAKLEGVLD